MHGEHACLKKVDVSLTSARRELAIKGTCESQQGRALVTIRESEWHEAGRTA